jgi:hypothetical protein
MKSCFCDKMGHFDPLARHRPPFRSIYCSPPYSATVLAEIAGNVILRDLSGLRLR